MKDGGEEVELARQRQTAVTKFEMVADGGDRIDMDD